MAGRFSLKNKRIIAPMLAVTVLLGSVLGVAVTNPIPAYAAKVTLKGINDIADQHTYSENDAHPEPFVILEVVPDKDKDAAICYLVAGEEPIHDGRSLKDMPSTVSQSIYGFSLIFATESEPNARWILTARLAERLYCWRNITMLCID